MSIAALLVSAVLAQPADRAVFHLDCGIAMQAEGKDDPSLDEKMAITRCLSYVRGVVDTVGLVQPFKVGKTEVCLNTPGYPIDVVKEAMQLIDVDPRFAEARPRILILVALAKLHPCK